MASSNNCCRHLCFAYKLCHRVQRIEFWGFLVDFMLLMRNKNRKNRKFENLVILTFCTFFKKCLVDVRQNLSLFIEFRGFHFSPPSRFQRNTCFQYAISCFEKAYRNNIASNFWQVAVCGIHMSKSFTGYHILLLELTSFQKLQPPNHRQRQTVNNAIRIQRFHNLQHHRRFLVLFSMLYPLF